ncbi:AI-2E family transporter [Neptunomonas qingdaonensis]|uniref:Predicted PurR-regulated permease PerM n=1 Tax=Neptunomonas qingdaonensis TaxID=1045558 RepID=A0A1I2TBC2_9GAMM|nr:AI-2E family transporter [Neptunomonas qingdaonensis]SFG60577.1 Predicted PurR-regulated permease PerM [Neptunomonas qingdaonensis]
MINNESGQVATNKPLTNADVPKRSVYTVSLYGLLALALLYTLYFAKSLLMPILVALLFSLLLSPLVTLFKRFYIPRTLSAIILLAMIGGPVTMLAIELTEPAQKWLAQLPQLSTKLTKELDDISLAISPDSAPKVNTQASPPKEKSFKLFGFFSKDDPPEVIVGDGEVETHVNSELSEHVIRGGIEKIISILGATPVVIAQFVAFVILVLFLLVFGPRLYDSYLEIFLSEQKHRRPATLKGKLQKELSRYILTVTIINTLLGIVTAGVFWMMDVDDALLWGALVGVLNFAPYVGPIVALMVLSLAGVTQYGMEWVALLPAAVYFGINLLEAQFITPTVLGRHLRLNPLILVVWLFIWGWLWGAAGVLLAVPLLVCLKLAAAQLNIMTDWVKLIETSADHLSVPHSATSGTDALLTLPENGSESGAENVLERVPEK